MYNKTSFTAMQYPSICNLQIYIAITFEQIIKKIKLNKKGYPKNKEILSKTAKSFNNLGQSEVQKNSNHSWLIFLWVFVFYKDLKQFNASKYFLAEVNWFSGSLRLLDW